MAALIPDPQTGLPVLAPEDESPVDLSRVPFVGPWEGTLTFLPLPPVELWMAPGGQTLALGEETVLVINDQEVRLVVVASQPAADGVVYQLVAVPPAVDEDHL